VTGLSTLVVIIESVRCGQSRRPGVKLIDTTGSKSKSQYRSLGDGEKAPDQRWFR
jgi:hypothetical protein